VNGKIIKIIVKKNFTIAKNVKILLIRIIVKTQKKNFPLMFSFNSIQLPLQHNSLQTAEINISKRHYRVIIDDNLLPFHFKSMIGVS
jgi:hypothetical protein